MRILKRPVRGPSVATSEGPGLAGADLRLPRRAGAVSIAFPLLLVPQLGLIRTARSSGCCNAGVAVWALLAVPRRSCGRAASHALACALTVAALAPAFVCRRPRHHLGRGPLLRRPRRLQRDQRLPARRRHREPRRRSAVPERQPAVPFARRVPLPRGAGAPGDGGARRAAARARAGRRRRHGGARGAEVPERRAGHAGRARPAHDARCSRPQPLLRSSTPTRCVRPSCARQRRRLRVAGGAPTSTSTSSSSTSPTRPTSRSASSTRRASTSWSSAPARRAATPWCRRTSPLIARKSFWTVVTTIEAPAWRRAVPRARAELRRVGLRPRQPPAVPAAAGAARGPALPAPSAGLPALFDFPPDMARVPAEVNRLSNQVLVQTFEDEWGKVQR